MNALEQKNINVNDIYIINPSYRIRYDVKRARVGNNNSLYFNARDSLNNSIDNFGFSWGLHPNLAYIFSEFNGEKRLCDIARNLATELDWAESEVMDALINYIDNEEVVITPLRNEGFCSIPKRFLIKKQGNAKGRVLSKEWIDKIFEHGTDLSSVRHYIPEDMTIMINNRCFVDCEYCYADKSVKVTSPLPFSRIKELIHEASELGMRDVAIGGGEFFLYPHWPELIDELRAHEYAPYISTKYPLNEKMVQILKEKQVSFIQLSLDTVNKDELKKMLHVGDDYLEKIKKSIRLLNEANIEIVIKPVITKYNDSVASVVNLLDWLKEYKMVKSIMIAPGAHSIYKPFNFSSTVEKINAIKDVIDHVKDRYHFKITVQGENAEIPKKDLESAFDQRSMCSGNLNSFYVLPDGQVTLCEQLYWHPFFNLGNLATQSIMEVWNGEKALALWNFSQEEVREESPCKQCQDFEKCRRGKGNCWRLAVAAYGAENYDYPAPNCPLSLPVTRPYYTPDK
ncbi:MAG: radical SAM protein [Bacteroidales bacterium]|jgi:radical SAM protein with 4Fe4S-binding SPASM domain|nr:radical SAM protein [Bacteroidales bacterium]